LCRLNAFLQSSPTPQARGQVPRQGCGSPGNTNQSWVAVYFYSSIEVNKPVVEDHCVADIETNSDVRILQKTRLSDGGLIVNHATTFNGAGAINGAVRGNM
jgi:hypothetical protein